MRNGASDDFPERVPPREALARGEIVAGLISHLFP